MHDEIDQQIEIMRLKLSDSNARESIAKLLRDTFNGTVELNKKCEALNGLGIFYFLHPDTFNDFSETEMKIIRNPIERFYFLSGIKISDGETLEKFNYEIDDKDRYEINLDNFENTNFPFHINHNENWSFENIGNGSVYYYNIVTENNIWKIVYESHGHNNFKFENHLFSLLSNCIKMSI